MADPTQPPTDTPVFQEPPPTWQDVEATPEFQQADPSKKLIAFSRWHDDAYNYASQQPDWNDVKDQFNINQAKREAVLRQDAGGITVDQARQDAAQNVFRSALETARADARSGGQPMPEGLTRQQTRDAFADQPSDIQRSFFNGPVPNEPTDEHQNAIMKLLSFDKQVGLGIASTLSQNLVGAVKGVVRYATPEFTPQDVDPNSPEWMQKLTGWGNEKAQSIHDWMVNAGDLLGQTQKEIPGSIGVKQGTAGSGVGEFAGGIAPYVAALPAAVIAHVANNYGRTYDETGGDRTAAGASAAFGGVTDLAFMGLGHALTPIAGKLVPKNANAITDWAVRTSFNTAGNIDANQLIQAADAAINAKPGERYDKFYDKLTEFHIGDVAAQAGFAHFAAVEGRAKALENAKANPPKSDAQTTADNARAAGAPEVAKAVEQNVVPVEEAVQAPPPVEVGVEHDSHGNSRVTVNVKTEATVPQIEAQREQIQKSDLDPEHKAQAVQALDNEIQTRQQPPAVEAPVPEAPAAEPTPPLKEGERVVTVERPDGTRYLAAFGDKYWDIRGEKIPAIGKAIPGEPEARTDGMLPKGDKIVEAPAAEPAAPTTEPATPEQRLAAPQEPLAPAPAPRPLAPVAQEEVTPPPTEKEVKNAQLAARTPEEKAAAVTKTQDDEVKRAVATGQVPDLNSIAGRQGGREKVQETQAKAEAAVREAYPPGEVPQGSKVETATDPNGTGIKLPSVQTTGADGVTRGEDHFTNDVETTAAQLDNGRTIVIPDAIVEGDKVNPAIDFAWNAKENRWEVKSVETKYGKVDGPTAKPWAKDPTVKFSDEYKNDPKNNATHKDISVGDQAALDAIVNKKLGDMGVDKDVIDQFDEQNNPRTTDPEHTVEVRSEKPASPTVALENANDADAMGMLSKDKSVKTSLDAIADGKVRATAVQRTLARFLRSLKLDFAKLKLQVVNDLNFGSAGLYHLDTANPEGSQISVNLAAEHGNGLVGTLLHEVVHHVTYAKFLKGYKLTDVEAAAKANLQKIYDHVTTEIYKRVHGKEGTADEVSAWAKSQGDLKNPDRNSLYYGLSRVEEFATEVLTNRRLQKLMSGIKGLDIEGSGTAKNRSLLKAWLDEFNKFFFGKPVATGSVFDQATREVMNLSERPVSPEAIQGKTEDLKNYGSAGRGDLEDQLKKSGYAMEDLMTMTTSEMRNILGNKGSVIGDTGKIDQNMWLAPDGTHIPAPDGDHYKAALGYLAKNDPKTFKKIEKLGRNPELNELYDIMDKAGYTRIVHGGNEIFAATSKLSDTHRAALEQAGIEQEARVRLDQGGRRSKDIYSPPGLNEDLAFAGGSTPDKVRIRTTLDNNGKASHQLQIDNDASRGDMLAMQQNLDNIKGLSAADRERMNDVLASKLGPTDVESVWKGKQKISYGYDAAGTIANERGRQAANDVSQEFGGAKPSEAESKDRQAMPFIIEAGGNREELVRDLNRVANAKEPPKTGLKKLVAAAREKIGKPYPTLAEQYTPIVQYALDNFERLAPKAENYRKVIKDQLERERGVGINVGEIDNYVTRLLQRPDMKNDMGVSAGKTGSPRYFLKGRQFEKLSDAIAEGYAPRSEGRGNPTDIVELTQRRVENGERLVQQKLLENELKNLKMPDGRPIIGNTEQYESVTGQTHTRTPAGYDIVQTGSGPVYVHHEVKPLMDALYSQGSIPNFIKQTAGFLKRNTLVLDTYHVGRILFKELAYGGKNRIGYGKGLALLEYKDKDLDSAVQNGDISQAQADYAKANRPVADMLIKNGLNVGRVSDNLTAQHAAAIPFIKNFNPWVFQKLSRGAMLQVAIDNFHRNLSRLGGEGHEQEAARQTALEYNEVFGNLQNQSLFKNKRFQDTARALVLAPNWAESQLMAEGRGFAQLARAPLDIARGRRIGTVAQGQLTAVLGMLAFNQVLNYLFTGHSTFENKDGRKLDAFIPGGKAGFWFNPFEIAAEYSFMAHRYGQQHMSPLDIVARIAANKLGPIGRGLYEGLSGHDWQGKAFQTNADRIVASLTDALPLPIGASSAVEKDPRARLLGLPIGLRPTRQPGALEKQVLQSAGLKVTPELTPRAEVYALAHPFRQDKSYTDNAPAEYRDLRTALDNQQTDNAKTEIDTLLSRGKTIEEIRKAVPFTPEKFTGNAKHEVQFLKSLTPDQKKLYDQAQADHRANAQRLNTILSGLSPEQRKLSLQNKLNK